MECPFGHSRFLERARVRLREKKRGIVILLQVNPGKGDQKEGGNYGVQESKVLM